MFCRMRQSPRDRSRATVPRPLDWVTERAWPFAVAPITNEAKPGRRWCVTRLSFGFQTSVLLQLSLRERVVVVMSDSHLFAAPNHYFEHTAKGQGRSCGGTKSIYNQNLAKTLISLPTE